MGHPFLPDGAQLIHDNYLGELPRLTADAAEAVRLLARGFTGIDDQTQKIIDAAMGRTSKRGTSRLPDIDALMAAILSKIELIAKHSKGRASKGTVASVRKDGERLRAIRTLLRKNIAHSLELRDRLRELENCVQKLAGFYSGRYARP